jgi:hypothetical protein
MAMVRKLGPLVLWLWSASAVYEDQVGQLDWRRDHVGVPTTAVYSSKVSGCR